MQKEVILRSLKRQCTHELFSSKSFWIGFVIYAAGIIIWRLFYLVGGIMMLFASLIMLATDWRGIHKVIKRFSRHNMPY